MKRSNFYLDEQQLARLSRLAEHQGVSMSELLRRVINAYLDDHDASNSMTLTYRGHSVTVEFDWLSQYSPVKGEGSGPTGGLHLGAPSIAQLRQLMESIVDRKMSEEPKR